MLLRINPLVDRLEHLDAGRLIAKLPVQGQRACIVTEDMQPHPRQTKGANLTLERHEGTRCMAPAALLRLDADIVDVRDAPARLLLDRDPEPADRGDGRSACVTRPDGFSSPR